MLPLGHASEAGEIAMTSLDANALTDDLKGMEFLAQTIGSTTDRPDVASRFGAGARSPRLSLKARTTRLVSSGRRLAAESELI